MTMRLMGVKSMRPVLQQLLQHPTQCSRRFHASHWRQAITTINVPTMGDSISEGTLVQLVKSAGEAVHADEVVAILETDKVSVDVMTPVAGTIVDVFAQLDENVLVGNALFSVDDSRAPDPAKKAGGNASSSSAPKDSPVPEAESGASSSTSPSSSHRQPLIQFLGKRSLLPSKASPLSASPVASAESSPSMALQRPQPSSAEVLSFQHVKRVPLSSTEVEAINSGIGFL